MNKRLQILTRTSDLYIGKSTLFKSFLVAGVLVISALFIWYTLTLIDQLQKDTRDQVEKYVRLWQLAANSPNLNEQSEVLPFIFEEIIVKATFPIIVIDPDDGPVAWRNVKDVAPEDTTQASREKLTREAEKMYEDNGEYPLYFAGTHVNYLRYGDSEIVNQLKIMPFIAIGIVLAFMIMGIIGFQNIRRSEERYIWVGMAKETAHQLGTPLSSLMGWLEVIHPANRRELSKEEEKDLLDTTVDNMKVDVVRLQRVANRFGLIGSIPELASCDLNEVIEESVVYYRRRLPFEGAGIQLNFEPGPLPSIDINRELFGWVLENLIKNAMQAVDAKEGRIHLATSVDSDGTTVRVEITDNGRGITAAAARKIFRPGFTTKKRGWGMGLTLVKRIVEEYHRGRIHLLRSRPGETVFEILLPARTQTKGKA